MPSQKSPVLLDIDLDFILNADANNGNSILHENKFQETIKTKISGKTMAKRLKPWLAPHTKVFLCLDHQEALYYWDALKVRGATCFHVDAHHDCWSDEVIDVKDRTSVHCGSYLAQAMVDGVVRHMTYVPAFFRYLWEEKDDLRYQLKKVKIRKQRWEVRHWKKFIQERQKADIVTICLSAEWFPKRFFPHFVSVCKTFGVRKKHIDKIYRQACEKWRDCVQGFRSPGEPINKTHFRFPYDEPTGVKIEVRSHR